MNRVGGVFAFRVVDIPSAAHAHHHLMHPAFIYAFEKCGFLVTDQNADRFTPDELEAWDDAIAEWEADHPDQEGP